MKYEDIIHRCFRCGYCKFTDDYQDYNCPSYRKFRFEVYSPGGRMWLIRAWLNHEIEPTAGFAKILYSCATCNNCVEHCVMPFRGDLVNIFESAKGELVEGGLVPREVRDFLEAIGKYSNPYQGPRKLRGKWSEGLNVRQYSGEEFLFYVGCVGSYDEIGQRMPMFVVPLLAEAGLSMGILGSEEACDGNDVKALGEMGLFEKLAENNIRKFNENGVKKIITLDPHAFNAFKNEYPKMGVGFEIWHYTEVLAELIKDKKLSFSEYDKKVTYHDSCYLGRHNEVYEPPREILKSIPGLELVEMSHHRENAFCCGGGGGNFITDMIGAGEDSPSRIRVREAMDTGAEILAVACPICLKMLDDAVKTEGFEERLKVQDVAEIVSTAMSK